MSRRRLGQPRPSPDPLFDDDNFTPQSFHFPMTPPPYGTLNEPYYEYSPRVRDSDFGAIPHPTTPREKDALLRSAYSPTAYVRLGPRPSPRRVTTARQSPRSPYTSSTSTPRGRRKVKGKKTGKGKGKGRGKAKTSTGVRKRPRSARGRGRGALSLSLSSQAVFASPRATPLSARAYHSGGRPQSSVGRRRPQSARGTRGGEPSPFYDADPDDLDFIQDDDGSSSEIDVLLETAIERTGAVFMDTSADADYTQYNLLGPKSKITHIRSHLDEQIFLRDPERVLRSRIELLALTKLLLTGDNYELVVAHKELSDCYMQLPEPRPNQALQHGMMAAELNENSEAGSRPLARQHLHPLIMLSVARALLGQGRHRQAESVLQEALRLNKVFHGQAVRSPTVFKEDIDGDGDSGMAGGLEPKSNVEIYLELAKCAYHMSHPTAGVSFAHHALRLMRCYHPDTHPEIAIVRARLGRLVEDEAEAIEHLHAALDTFYTQLGPGSAQLARVAMVLADKCTRAQRLSDARDALRCAVAAYKLIFGDNHSSTVSVQKRLLLLSLQMGDYVEVLAPMQDVLLKESQLFGRNSEQSGETCSVLGMIHLTLGHFEDAERMYKLALAIERKVRGDDPQAPRMKILLNRLQSVQKQAVLAHMAAEDHEDLSGEDIEV